MSKKKAVACTILFAIVLYAIVIGTYFIRTADGAVSLFTLFSYTITGGWLFERIEKFYKWLMKMED